MKRTFLHIVVSAHWKGLGQKQKFTKDEGQDLPKSQEWPLELTSFLFAGFQSFHGGSCWGRQSSRWLWALIAVRGASTVNWDPMVDEGGVDGNLTPWRLMSWWLAEIHGEVCRDEDIWTRPRFRWLAVKEKMGQLWGIKVWNAEDHVVLRLEQSDFRFKVITYN